MDFYGNSSDPLAKTLKELAENEISSNLGNAGDFFKPVHDRDTHVKPKNRENKEFEFNAALLDIDNSVVMLKYIILKNSIIEGKCALVEETNSIDKENGATTVFIKWLQPEGMYVLGSIDIAIPDPSLKKEEATADVVDDTQVTKKHKGKGSRKKNAKIKL